MGLTKVIELSGEDKIGVICRLISIGSDAEIFVIKTIFGINNGKACVMDTDDKNIACLKGGMNPNTFNISLSRLMKKGVVAKIGKMYQLHQVFMSINESESITIKWK